MINRILVSLVAHIEDFYYKRKLKILKFGHIGTNVKILNGFNIGYAENLYIEDDVIIGPNCFINCDGGVVIKRGTGLGPNLTLYSITHDYKNPSSLPFNTKDKDIRKKVIINENCWIGCNTTILPGVEIGERCIIAAGSVVTKSIPPFSLAGGNPAKVIEPIPVDNYYQLKADNQIVFYIEREK